MKIRLLFRTFRARVAVTTVVESAGVAAWLVLLLSGRPVLAFLVLFVAFFGEHLARMALFGIPLSGVRVRDTAAFSLVEAVAWAVWEAVLLPRLGPILGNAAFAALLAVEHTLTANVVLGRPLLSNVFDAGKLNASVVEAIGAGLWRGSAAAGTPAGVAILIFAAFNQLEHEALIAAEEAARGLPQVPAA